MFHFLCREGINAAIITYDNLQYPEMFFSAFYSSFLCFQRMTNFCKINVGYSNCFGGGWDSKANDNTRNGNFRNIVEDIKLTPRTLSDVSTSCHVMIYFRGITSSRLGCSYIIPSPSCVVFFLFLLSFVASLVVVGEWGWWWWWWWGWGWGRFIYFYF